jgi:hypothetical protein
MIRNFNNCVLNVFKTLNYIGCNSKLSYYRRLTTANNHNTIFYKSTYGMAKVSKKDQ